MSQITIIGLGLIGTSIGLGLKKLEADYIVVGHDRDPDAMTRAGKLGAIDKSHWNLIAASEDADMLILALPLNEIPPTLEALREDLKPGSLVMDTASLKRPIQAAAETYLPHHVHFIGTNPILPHGARLRVEDASAELFQGALWAICPRGEAHTDAVTVVANMVQSLGARPYFLSPEEHDGLVAAAETLPMILAGSLLHATTNHASWREIRKMAGGQFERVSYLPDFKPETLAEAMIDNRDNVQNWIETMLVELEGWRKALAEGDAEILATWIEEAQHRREEWLKLQQTQDWDERLKPHRELEYDGFWARMFGYRKRKRPDKKERS